MRWIRAAGRGLLVAAVVLTGYVTSGTPADGAHGGGRGPLTLATAGDLTGLSGATARRVEPYPSRRAGHPRRNPGTLPTRRTRR